MDLQVVCLEFVAEERIADQFAEGEKIRAIGTEFPVPARKEPLVQGENKSARDMQQRVYQVICRSEPVVPLRSLNNREILDVSIAVGEHEIEEDQVEISDKLNAPCRDIFPDDSGKVYIVQRAVFEIGTMGIPAYSGK